MLSEGGAWGDGGMAGLGGHGRARYIVEIQASGACLSPLQFARALKAATATAARHTGSRSAGRAGSHGGKTMDLTTERQDDVLFVDVGGRVDIATAAAFEEELRYAIDDTDRGVILDLARLDYIGSAGLRVMLVTANLLRRQDARLVLCALPDPVRAVFRVAGFDRIPTIRETRADARAALGVPRYGAGAPTRDEGI